MGSFFLSHCIFQKFPGIFVGGGDLLSIHWRRLCKKTKYVIFYIASKSEIAAEIFSIIEGESFDTFSTRQDLSTIPI